MWRLSGLTSGALGDGAAGGESEGDGSGSGDGCGGKSGSTSIGVGGGMLRSRDKGDDVGRVSSGRGGAWAMRFGAGEGTGEGPTSTGTVSALGTEPVRNVGISGTGGEGVLGRDEGAVGAWQSCCGTVSWTGSGKTSGLGRASATSGKQWAHCLYKTV